MFQKKQPPPSDFQSRVQAYEAARKKGLVFQAKDTIGGVPLRKRRSMRRGGRMFALILVVSVLFAMKAGLLAYVGQDTYRSRLIPYIASTASQDRIIAYVMQPDPVSLWGAKLFNDITMEIKVLVDRYMPAPLRP